MTIPDDAWTAQWLWHPRLVDADNVHLLAWREFELPGVPPAATLRITVNSRYRLWVNGVEVGRGPSPPSPKGQSPGVRLRFAAADQPRTVRLNTRSQPAAGTCVARVTPVP